MRFLILFVLFSTSLCYGQLADDFSDGDFSANPTWQGDVTNFIVNDQFQLQLNAPDAGVSLLYTSVNFADSTEWNFWIELDFSPSNSNQLTVYLFLDNSDLEIANGYFLEIGETGSDDAIGLYRKEGNNTTLLGSGTMGAMASEPARARVSIKHLADGTWTMKVDYDGGNLLLDDLMLIDDQIQILGDGFFGFDCSYTSTRTDRFFFDDIEIKTPEQDLTGPQFISFELISPDSMMLSFDEILLEETIALDKISIDQSIGNAVSAMVNPIEPNKIEVRFGQELSSGIIYQLCAEGILDLASNASAFECQEIFLTVDPSPGDLFVNEILFNPLSGGSDFVEIINASDKFISLDNLIIRNADNQQFDELESGIVMQPNEILAFTSDPQVQIDFYQPQFPENIIEQEIPSFNADEGNVSLMLSQNNTMITLDSFDYSDDMHFVLVDDVKGVSLEKLIASGETNALNAWNSAAEQVNFATPGYENSNGSTFAPSNEMISIPSKVFSPNGDGDKDLFAIAFNLDGPGYLGTVTIFDDRGFLVRQLTNNLLLGTESIVYWDGISSEGTLSDIGIYIVLVELFDSNGRIEELKETFVLADFLD